MMSALIAGVAAPLRTPRAGRAGAPARRVALARAALDDASDRERPAPSGARSSRRSFFSAAFAATLSGASDPALGRRDPARASTRFARSHSPPHQLPPAPLPASPRARVVPARSAETDVIVSPPRPLFLRRAGAFLVESSAAAPALLADSDAASASASAFATSASAAFELAEAAPGAEIYFGNGCFWGRQHEFVETERATLGRSDDEVTSLVGYAGGFSTKGPDGKVCYYYGSPDTVYERLGHGEVVRTTLSDGDAAAATRDLRAFSRTYFKNFKKVRGLGMSRLDPQDAGAGYRNMIGLPGGMDSPLMRVIEEENVNGMKLLRGEGNRAGERGKPTEDDVFNAVWIYDSNDLPFYAAEVYHQFHDGLGYRFPEEYTVELKKKAMKRGLVRETGCPEMRERRFAEFETIAS